MPKRYSIATARDNLTKLVHNAEKHSSVVLTRRGRPVAALISYDRYQKLLHKESSFWDALEKFRSQTNLEAVDVTGVEFENLRDQSGGREVDL